jgi:hypothetical protein
LKAVVWKFGGIRRGTGKGSCPLCLGSENVKRYIVELPRNKVKYALL